MDGFERMMEYDLLYSYRQNDNLGGNYSHTSSSGMASFGRMFFNVLVGVICVF